MSELKLLQKTILIIADEIERICNKYSIKYTLIGGSMLGAIRHKGFIPWDDDMDIAMRRADYNRFVSICKTELNPKFELLTNTNNRHYIYGFSKILLKGTCLVEKGLENVKYPQRIFVDVFCFDNIPDNRVYRFFQKNKDYFYKKILRQKQGIGVDPDWKVPKKIVFSCLTLISKCKKQKEWKQLLNRNMCRYRNVSTRDISNMAGFYGYDKETIPTYSFDKLIYVPFEDRRFQVCCNYDDILRSYYGDYMKLPPKNKRRTHGFSKIDFGQYSD